MIKNIRIKEIYTNSLSCEPLLERTQNGELLCVCQCDGPIDLQKGLTNLVNPFSLYNTEIVRWLMWLS